MVLLMADQPALAHFMGRAGGGGEVYRKVRKVRRSAQGPDTNLALMSRVPLDAPERPFPIEQVTEQS
jgi:hypothetical protein